MYFELYFEYNYTRFIQSRELIEHFFWVRTVREIYLKSFCFVIYKIFFSINNIKKLLMER